MPAGLSTDGPTLPHGPSPAYPPAPAPPPPRFDAIPAARGRRVAVLAAHHVEVDGQTLTGGAEKYLLLAARALLDAGATLHVGYSGSGIYGALLEEYDPRRLTVERTGWLNDTLSGDREVTFRRVTDRRRWLRSTRADTVFCVQQASGGAFVASLAAARSLGLRVVATLRQPPDESAAPAAGTWRAAADRWLRPGLRRRRLAAACCHRLIYNSRRVAGQYSAVYGFSARKACVIFNGDQPGIVRGDPGAPGRTASPRRIGVVGRLTEAKGVDVALAAFERVAKRCPDASLVYFGEGPMEGRLRAAIRRAGLSGRVELAGYQRDRERMYARIDVLASASRRESLSNCAVEAQMRGIPCVVTDVGGMGEAVIHGETGFVAPAGDADALGLFAAELISDADRYERFSAAARAHAAQAFDLTVAMRRTVEAILAL